MRLLGGTIKYPSWRCGEAYLDLYELPSIRRHHPTAEIVDAGGQWVREPEPENGEPPHLAMCVDTEGNEIMLSRKRA
jgi:predicted enzyme related to lactoylglutathione lyase